MEPPLIVTAEEDLSLNNKDSDVINNINNDSPSGFLHNKVLSISTTSIKSLIPNFYSITGSNNFTPVLNSNSTGNHNLNNTTDSYGNFTESFLQETSNIVNVSDELARESDVTVSTNVTPQAEYKGFASYVISCIFVFVWICWSILPDRVLNYLGVYYYPSRWWALAIPSYVIVVMIYTYIALACYNIEHLTLPLDDNRNIVDNSGIIITQLKNFKTQDIEKYISKGTSGVWDLPISIVNEVLYLNPDSEDVILSNFS